MRIRMLTGICGPEINVQAGEETDKFDRDTAIRLIESGQAVPATAAVERAVKPPSEIRADPLDHDGDDEKGGSPKGASSTRSRGAAKRR